MSVEGLEEIGRFLVGDTQAQPGRDPPQHIQLDNNLVCCKSVMVGPLL